MVSLAFYGSYFIFDDRPCEEFNCMIYDLGTYKDEAGTMYASSTVVEDKVARRFDTIYYNMEPPKQLEFAFTFGADTCKINRNEPLDRWDMDAITSWLTNKDGYHWLEIFQPDLDIIRYKCIITELKYHTVG